MTAMLPLSIALSAALLVILCRGDPKRRRSTGMAGRMQGVAMRRLLTAASLLPGIGHAVGGDAAAFLIWLGGYAVAGWLVTLAFAGMRDTARP